MTEPTAGQLHARKVAQAVQSGEDPRSVVSDDPVGDKTLAYWTCEVGPAVRAVLPDGADFPMRQGVRAAFRVLTGVDPDYLSSGWGRQAPPDIEQTLYELFDDEDFMAAHLNARSLAKAVAARLGQRR